MGEERHMNGAIRRALAGQSREEHAGPCPDSNLVAAYLEGSLSEGERVGIEAHASRCPACQELLALSLRLSDEELTGTEEAAVAPPARKVLFRFSIPVSAVAALALAAGLVAFLTWQHRSEKTATTEIAQLRVTRAPAPQIAEPEAPPPTARREAESSVATGRSDLADAGSAESRGRESSFPSKNVVRPQATENMIEADKPAQKEAEAAVAAAPEPPAPNVEALQRAAAVPPKADREAVGGFPGGVVGGIMPPRPLEESKEPATQVTTLRVSDQSPREQAGFKALAKDEIAEGKEKTSSETLDAAANGAHARGNPREAVQTLAAALKGNAVDEQLRTGSNRQYGIVAGSRESQEGKKSRLISGRTLVLHSGYWIDLECAKHPESDFAEPPSRGPEWEQIRKAMPEVEELIRSGVPVVLYWKGKNVVLR